MARETGSETIDSIAAAAEQHNASDAQAFQVQVDDSQTPILYSTTARVMGSAEEINIDFAGQMRPTGPASGKLKIDQRVILSPWAAKRLAISLTQAVMRYEQTYGELELDPRKRVINQPVGGAGGIGGTGGSR